MLFLEEPAVKLHMLDGSAEPEAMETLVDTELLRDRNQSFEHFRKSYRKNEAIEENKATLKEVSKNEESFIYDDKSCIENDESCI